MESTLTIKIFQRIIGSTKYITNLFMTLKTSSNFQEKRESMVANSDSSRNTFILGAFGPIKCQVRNCIFVSFWDSEYEIRIMIKPNKVFVLATMLTNNINYKKP